MKFYRGRRYLQNTDNGTFWGWTQAQAVKANMMEYFPPEDLLEDDPDIPRQQRREIRTPSSRAEILTKISHLQKRIAELQAALEFIDSKVEDDAEINGGVQMQRPKPKTENEISADTPSPTPDAPAEEAPAAETTENADNDKPVDDQNANEDVLKAEFNHMNMNHYKEYLGKNAERIKEFPESVKIALLEKWDKVVKAKTNEEFPYEI